MWWWLPGAMAATVGVVVPEGEARVARPTLVQVAVLDEEGWAQQRPELEAESASLVPVEGEAGQGVWSWMLLPDPGLDQVGLRVITEDRAWTQLVAVRPAPEARIEVPARLAASAAQSELILRVQGDDLHPRDLGVVVPGGEVLGLEPGEDGVRLRLRPGVGAGARVLPVGVWDRRRDSRPVWTSVVLRSRMELSYDTEPGTTLELSVGARSYGPYVADDQGRVEGWIDHYPGETMAEAVFTDPVGNFTRAPLPLGNTSVPSLTSLTTTHAGSRTTYLRALAGDGRPWGGLAPTCRTPVGLASVAPLEPGTWVVFLPLEEQGELPVECALGSTASASFRVGAAVATQRSLRLRVWPEELSADFPVSEVTVSVEDARGERLSVEGVSVHADRGEVVARPRQGQDLVLRGEYRGYDALGEGPVSEDVVRAELSLPPGEGEVVALRVAHGAVPTKGQLLVHGRALDTRGWPLSGVPLALGAGVDEVKALTDERGWASAVVGIPQGQDPLVLEVRSGAQVRRSLALRGAGAWGGPQQPDLETSQALRIVQGRVAEIHLGVPPVLVSGGRAASLIHVTLLDRLGRPITDTWPAVTALHGQVEGLTLEEDGRFVVFYTPPPGDQAQIDTITAVAEGRSATAQLQLQVRPIQRAPGLAVGAISNFGAVTSPLISADVDVRTSLLSDSIMVRVGVGWYRSSSTTDDETARIRASFLPLTLGLVARRDPGRASQWLGLGLTMAPTREEVWYQGVRTSAGLRLLPPGFTLFGGVGWRIPGGELFTEARLLSITHPGGEASYRGLVGGLGAVAGYRVPF